MTNAIHANDLSAIYIEFRQRIYEYIYRKIAKPGTSNEEVEDMASEVFLRFIEATRRGTGTRTHLSGYIYRIAHNLLIDEYRRRSRRGASIDFDSLAGQAHQGLTPHEQVTSDIGCELIERCIERLSEQEAQAIELIVEGAASGQLGAILCIGESAAKGRLHRGRVRLAKLLYETGLAEEAGLKRNHDMPLPTD